MSFPMYYEDCTNVVYTQFDIGVHWTLYAHFTLYSLILYTVHVYIRLVIISMQFMMQIFVQNSKPDSTMLNAGLDY